MAPSFSDYPHIGLGFQLNTMDTIPTVGHFGRDRGFRSYLLRLPKEKVGVVLLANCDYHEDVRQEIVYSIIKEIMGRRADGYQWYL